MWHLPEGDFEYYKGTIDKIEFNVFFNKRRIIK